MRLRLERYLFPMLSVWAAVLYLHLLQCLAVFEIVATPLNFALFLLLVPYEYLVSRRFGRDGRMQDHGRPSRRGRGEFILNSLFWLVVYVIWVVLAGFLAKTSPGVTFYFPRFYLFAGMLWRAMSWLTILAAAIWLAAHYLLTIRWRRLRVFTSLMLPILLTFLLFLQQFYLGGLGGADPDAIARQPGVEKLLDKEELRAAIADDPVENRSEHFLIKPPYPVFPPDDTFDIRYQARGIYVEEAAEAILLTYGCTYCRKTLYSSSPTVVRKDLSTGRISYILGGLNIRQSELIGDSLFLAPWLDKTIYELSTQDLSVKRRIDYQAGGKLRQWEPMSILKDSVENRIYVGNEMHPALLAYNLDDDKLIAVLDFLKLGLIPPGGTAYYTVQAADTRLLYLAGVPGVADIFEVNPDTFAVTRRLDLGDAACTALLIDNEAGKLYYQSGFTNKLFLIDIARLQVERVYRGEFHARRLQLDRPRKALYILGFASGKVTALDLETGRRAWRVKVGGRATGMQLAGDALYVHSMAGAFRLDLPTLWGE